MASKAENKVLEISDDIIEKATDKIAAAIEEIPIEVSVGWKPIVIGASVATGIGIAAYFISSKIDDWKLAKYCKKYDEDGSDIHSNLEFKMPKEEIEAIRGIPGVAIVPTDLDNDMRMAQMKLEDILEENHYVNPSIEVGEYYDDFGDRIDGYTQKVIDYVKAEDTALYFDENLDSFVKCDSEDIVQGIDYCLANDSDSVFVANHDAQIVYDIQVDREHTLQEVLDDAGQEDLGLEPDVE